MSNASKISKSLVLDGELTVSKQIKNQFGSISSTSSASPTTIYTAPSGVNDQGALVHLLQLSNTNSAAAQVVNITVKTATGTAYGLIKNGSIPSGGALSVIGGNMMPLVTGSIIQAWISSGNSNNVEYILGVQEIKG